MDVPSPQNFTEWVELVLGLLTYPLFTVGDASFSASSLLKLVGVLFLILWIGRMVRRVLLKRVFPRLGIDTGLAHALSNITNYVVIFFGLLVALQASGINLGTLTVLFGALGVGIGFGLQTIAANFVSGLVLLIERPIQVGDRVQVGDLHGRVNHINIRATEVLTNDNIAVIVPNSEFVSQRVVNWSVGGDSRRHRIPVGVSYRCDPQLVKKALLEAAAEEATVLREPPPHVRLTGFGDSALDFELVVWTRELLHRRGLFFSNVNYKIHAALKRHGLEIPFPQRDLHLRSSVPLPLGGSPEADRAGSATTSTT